jgi:predicted HTH transcriptional regulator
MARSLDVILTDAREAIKDRQRELKAELQQLERQLKSLNSRAGTRTGRGPGRPAGQKATRSRAKQVPYEARVKQLVKAAQANPKASNPELAKALKTTPQNVAQLLNRTKKEKILSRTGKGKNKRLAVGANAPK